MTVPLGPASDFHHDRWPKTSPAAGAEKPHSHFEGIMPRWKHCANIALTAVFNLATGRFLTECHSGFRAYSRRYLTAVRRTPSSKRVIHPRVEAGLAVEARCRQHSGSGGGTWLAFGAGVRQDGLPCLRARARPG